MSARPVLVSLLLGLLSSCSSADSGLQPIVDVPSADTDAYPYAAIDTLQLSVARAGEDEPFALVSADVGDELDLTSIPFGDDLVVHLSGRSAGTELAYGRTCAIDVRPGGPVLEPHLYFSRLVRWGQGPQLVGPRAGSLLGASVPSKAMAVLLGENSSVIDVIDPTSADGQPVARQLEAEATARSGASMAVFGEGVLIIGGLDAAGDAVGVVDYVLPTEITPESQLLAIDGPAIRDHRSVELEDGSVLVVGGMEQSGPGAAFLHADSARLYSLVAGELSQRTVRPALAVPRAGHSSTRLGSEVGADVLIIGGLDAAGDAVAQAELFRPLRTVFENAASAQLITPRYAHQAVRLPGGFVLVIGGLEPDPGGGAPLPVRELELYDPVQGVFSAAGALPSAAGITGMSVTELPDGRFLLAGGDDIDGVAASTVLIARFDPIDGVVDLSLTDALASPRSGHAALVLCDGTVLVAGGRESAIATTERYSPPSLGRR